MTKPDDSSLNPAELRAVEERARKLLDRAAAWGTLPTPIDDILAAAEIQVAPTSLFDPARIVAYVRSRTADAAHRLKSAISKVLGLYDADERVIHIDDTVVESKQTFLKLHETGHHELPTHRKLFRLFQDCEKTLAPEIADQFEREANNFARFTLFQGDAYARCAADSALEIKTPMKLAKKFGASVYASVREFARTHNRACVVYVLEPIQYVEDNGVQAAVRRIEPSPAYLKQFGRSLDTLITPRPSAWPGPSDRPENDSSSHAFDNRPEWHKPRVCGRGFRHNMECAHPSLSRPRLDCFDDHSALKLRAALREVTRKTTMTDERETMQAIRLAIRQGRLKEPMRGADLDKVLGITWGGNFLAKHCLGTDSSTARFVRVSRGLYRLKD